MNVKLTLSVDKSIIEQARQYAHKKNKSISKMVEDYLKNITSSEKATTELKLLNSPLTNSLVGMFDDNGMDYKNLIEDARAERNI